MKNIQLTCAHALVKFLTKQKILIDGKKEPLFPGVFGIFGHGNVACLGQAADKVQRVTMELSGHSPFIVFDDVDLNKVTDMAITAKFRNNGQVCISPNRFYIHENKKDEFADLMVKKTKKTYVISIHTDGYQWLEGSAYWESPTLSMPTTDENKRALKEHLEGKKKQRKGV